MMQLVFPTEGDIYLTTLATEGKSILLAVGRVAIGLNCTHRPHTNAINNIQPYWDHTHTHALRFFQCTHQPQDTFYLVIFNNMNNPKTKNTCLLLTPR